MKKSISTKAGLKNFEVDVKVAHRLTGPFAITIRREPQCDLINAVDDPLSCVASASAYDV
jgi:hypothetical protein